MARTIRYASLVIFDLDRALSASGKAFAPHPALMDRSTPLSTYDTNSSSPRKDALLSQREASRHADAYGGAQAIDWVYDCIGLYADAASTADYVLTAPDGTRLVRDKTPGTPPEYGKGPQALYDLLDQPNPYMLYEELLSLLVIDLLLVGNAYWFKWRTAETGRPLALYRLAPSYVKINPDQYGPGSYEYQPPGVKNKLKIDPSNIIHFRRPNPHSNWYGMGVIQGAGRAMDLELAITDTVASYYENKAAPSLVVQSERRVPRDVFQKLRAQLRQRTRGSSKAGELLVLEAGLTANALSTSAADALFGELSRMSRDRVFTKFRANPRLFGIQDENTLDKLSDIRRDFDNSTLRPFFKRLSTQISFALAESYDCKFLIDHRSTLPSDEAIKVAESVAAMPGVKVREVRRQYAQFGIEESTGDKKLDDTVLNMPTPEADANGMVTLPNGTKVRSDKVGADRPLSSEPGRPPKGSNTRTIGVAGGKSLDAVLAELEVKAVSTSAPDNRLPNEQRPSDPFAAARRADIDGVKGMLQQSLANAASDLERALLDAVEGKALKTSDIVARVRNNEAWRTFRQAVKTSMQDALQRAASSGVMHSGLTPDEDVDYETIADAVIGRKGGLNDIVRTLKNRVVKRVKDARDADAERHDYNAVIQQAISEWSTGSAATIADTESTHAYNEAVLTVAELSGLTHVYVEDGEDHDEPCLEANGQTWTIEQARDNRVEHPNCRRAFLPLTAGQVA